jgi:hypothetical protein
MLVTWGGEDGPKGGKDGGWRTAVHGRDGVAFILLRHGDGGEEGGDVDRNLHCGRCLCLLVVLKKWDVVLMKERTWKWQGGVFIYSLKIWRRSIDKTAIHWRPGIQTSTRAVGKSEDNDEEPYARMM